MSSVTEWRKTYDSSDERIVAKLSGDYLSDFVPVRHAVPDIRAVENDAIPNNVALIWDARSGGARMREAPARQEREEARYLLAAALEFRSGWPVGGIDRSHPGVSVQRETDGAPAAGYYVARTYRALWAGLLLLALAWGMLSGIALATGLIMSPYAVMMGVLGTLVLGAALFTAGSRSRIRRKKP